MLDIPYLLQGVMDFIFGLVEVKQDSLGCFDTRRFAGFVHIGEGGQQLSQAFADVNVGSG